MTDNSFKHYQNRFMLTLMVLAILSLAFLFSPFLPALFFAILVATASYDYQQKLAKKVSKTQSALLMCFGVTLLIVLPLFYVLLVVGVEASQILSAIKNKLEYQDILTTIKNFLTQTPLPDYLKAPIITALENNIQSIVLGLKNVVLFVLGGLSTASLSFIGFVIIGIFALFYLYLDGHRLINYISRLSPLDNNINEVLIVKFSQLSITLMGSVLSIALLQGIIFGIGMLFIGQSALFFGVSMAIASFVPVLGGLIIWLPMCIYLFAINEPGQAVFVIFLGGVLVGGIIDNFIRPWLIMQLSNKFGQESVLEHTLITVLSTLAGIIQFGVMGLFFGPIIAAMAISIFHAYTLQYAKSLNAKN